MLRIALDWDELCKSKLERKFEMTGFARLGIWDMGARGGSRGGVRDARALTFGLI